MEKKKRVCIYIYLLYRNAGLKLIIKSYFQFFLLTLFFTIISIKNLGQEKNPYFTQLFFSLYPFFSANLSGFSFDF